MRQVEESNEDEAIDILSEAFQDDPVLNWIGNNSEGWVHFMFEFMVPMFTPAGLTYLTDEGNGAASWNGPGARGRGVGTRLISQVLRRCDEERVPAYLENSKRENLPFYQGHGFEVLEKIHFTPSAPPVWLMWREPR